MNEEEAIERLNRFKTIKVLYGNTYSMHLEQLEQLQNDIDTVLNLLEKKDAEYSDLKLKYEQNLRMCKHFIEELNKQDEMIDLMSIAIGDEPVPTEEYCIFRDFDCPVVGGNRDCKECVKQYFEKKVEEK